MSLDGYRDTPGIGKKQKSLSLVQREAFKFCDSSRCSLNCSIETDFQLFQWIKCASPGIILFNFAVTFKDSLWYPKERVFVLIENGNL
jgi:hypothetical protein